MRVLLLLTAFEPCICSQPLAFALCSSEVAFGLFGLFVSCL